MILNIRIKNSIEAPEGTVVITNDEFLTFARKVGSSFCLFTCNKDDFEYNLTDESVWTEYTKDELQRILKIK